MVSPYEELGNAVVILAAKDWREAVSKLKHGRKNKDAEIMKDDCERFFKSKYFSAFSTIDGNLILAKLEKEEGL